MTATEPYCGLSICAAPSGHDGDCASASVFADHDFTAEQHEAAAAALFDINDGAIRWDDIRAQHPRIRREYLTKAARVLNAIHAAAPEVTR